MRNPVRECESPAGQCCVISSLVSESHSSGCPWDKFTLGGESGRDGTAPLGVTGIQGGQEDSWLSPLCPGQHSLNPLLSSLVPGIVFTLQSGPKKSKFGVMRGQPAGDALLLFPLPLRESLQLQRDFLGVYFPAWGMAWFSEKQNIYSRSVWPDCRRRIKLLLQLHTALNPSRDGHSPTALLCEGICS